MNKVTVHRGLWHCGWPRSNGYPGAYPDRFLRYTEQFLTDLGGWGFPLLHLFSGSLPDDPPDIVTIDANPEPVPGLNPTHVLDLTRERIPYPDGHFQVVLADPPYSHKDYRASQRHYRMPEVPRYSFIPEAVRVLRPGGYLGVLHVMPYRTPPGCERVAVIGITTGTTQVIRCFSVFSKARAEAR